MNTNDINKYLAFWQLLEDERQRLSPDTNTIGLLVEARYNMRMKLLKTLDQEIHVEICMSGEKNLPNLRQ